MNESILNKPIVAMTGREFLELTSMQFSNRPQEVSAPASPPAPNKFVYGIRGIADLFQCSIPTANRIKHSGVIDGAITQVGRKIIVDSEVALRLVNDKQGGRKDRRNSK